MERDADTGASLTDLMAEFDGGSRWHVIAGLESPELYDLPRWRPPQVEDLQDFVRQGDFTEGPNANWAPVFQRAIDAPLSTPDKPEKDTQ